MIPVPFELSPFNLLALPLAAIILWRTEPALARMSRGTHWMIRYALLLLAGGALGIILNIAGGARVDFFTLLILAGIALLLVCERRLRALLAQRPGERHA